MTSNRQAPADDDDPLLWSEDAAKRAHLARSTWSYYKHKNLLPPPDDPDDEHQGTDVSKYRRRPRWRASTVDAFVANRLGRGHRSDLRKKKADRRERDAAALAEPTPEVAPALQAWLEANHTAVLEVAEALSDWREDLVAASSTPELLAEAIDAAGAAVYGRGPSKALASAVVRAMGLALGHSPQSKPIGLDPDSEVSQALVRHRHLRDEFNRLDTRKLDYS
ncbi:hypothetical protein EV385_6758 [Krasilnikovia cinnamomea]|uniref:Uncharacterized protein n=1 Tax=Krasilnikovia cinnamomea TaxID=349313 RepID=A0A4Q7Z9E7_9ACTN|nr:hypothetical protein [Krasilnikovia cinnamomea]RZU46681.1 hypothetical protein EV385_6758 [Krasilnikovia cinnamomea]